jgi:phage baseplate assembly protein V
MMRAIQKLLDPIRRRLGNIVARAVITLADDGLKIQGLQLRALADEVLDNVERFQQYGVTSVPVAGAEAILLCLGGHRDHPVVVAVEDRRYRLKGLASGEMAIYDDLGQKVHLKRDGIYIETTQDVVVKADGKATIEAGGTAEIKGATGAAVKGIVQGDCICAYTGAPHPHISATVKGSV